MSNHRIYHRIFEKKKFLDTKRPLPKAVLMRVMEELHTEFIFNSNAIEGNALTLKETRLVLAEGMTIKGRPLKDHLEATNHLQALDFIYKFSEDKSDITESDTNRIHQIVLKDIEKEYAGRYRPGQVRILGANFIPPNAQKIPALMEEFVGWLKGRSGIMNIIEYAAMAHYRIAHIHPYVDGNGRVARLLMNLILIRDGYPPAIILNNDRKKYYRALNLADRDEFQLFFKLVGQAVERSLDIYLRAFGLERGELLSLADLAKDAPYSQDYLSLLARQGNLSAIKLGRNWLSTKKALEDYIEGRMRKRKPGFFP